MNAQCTKCGTSLGLTWTFCPHCGLPITHEALAEASPAERERSSVPGAFGGLLFGIITAPVLLIFGTLLCLTGLGAILGVPMIIAGILAPLAGPLFGIREHEVRCPHCNTREITVADNNPHYCPNCEREFAVSEHYVVRAS